MTKYTETDGSSHYLVTLDSDAKMSYIKAQDQKSSHPIIAFIKDAFLPFGFPASVTEDYVPYQLYDTAQVRCVTFPIVGLGRITKSEELNPGLQYFD